MTKTTKKELDILKVSGKVPVQSKDIEKKILGIMLLEPKAVPIVKDTLFASDFYSEANKLICQSIFDVYKTTIPDVLMVCQELIKLGKIEDAGGVFAVSKLINDIIITPHTMQSIRQYCLVIKKHSIQRKLSEYGIEIASKSYDETQDTLDLLTEAKNKINAINNEIAALEIKTNAEIAMNVIEAFDDKVYKAQNDIPDEDAIYTGMKEWDEVNGALFNGLYVIAGRPAMGKGVHMTELACRMGKKYDVGIINGEMTNEQLFKRIACNLMSIDNFLFKKNPKYVKEDEQNKLKEGLQEAINLKLHVYDNRIITNIANKIRFWVLEKGVKCVLADFLTLFKVPYELERYYTKTQQVDYILDVFTQLCKDLKIPIIIYVQMNREILGRHGTKEPNLGDLKQSGSIEELAYQVSFLHRPEYYNEKDTVDEFGEDMKGLMYQIIAKHRDGEMKRIKYKSYLNMSQIKDWEEMSFIRQGENIPFDNEQPF